MRKKKMANIIIKSDERRAHEERVARAYGIHPDDPSGREAAEIIEARSNEAYEQLKKMEEKP
jgi:hypothetical protein